MSIENNKLDGINGTKKCYVESFHTLNGSANSVAVSLSIHAARSIANARVETTSRVSDPGCLSIGLGRAASA